MVKKLSVTDWLIFTGFFALALFLTFNKHSRSGIFNYHSVVFGDKAGYYLYLPATFIYGYNPDSYLSGIDEKLGNGFKLDLENKKVRTKYTCGVAILQFPFFIAAHLMAQPLGFERDGFSVFYNWFLNIGAVFYLLLGLIFLHRFLSESINKHIIRLVLLSLFLGTNLYYYAIAETVMTHIYSFFLFCAFLFLLRKSMYLKHSKVSDTIVFGLICGLIVLIRPSNIMFLSAFFFLDVKNSGDIINRFRRIIHPAVLIPVIISCLVVWLPQFIYWYYLEGEVIAYTYKGEGFLWLNPQLHKTWFSPLNGLFLYSPFYIVIVAGLVYMILSKKQNGIYISVLFITISYVFSCWWDFSFGCSYGSRSFVEYLAILSIPLAYIFQKISTLSKPKIWVICIIVIILVGFNLKLIYTYDGCFEGGRNWDWDSYLELVLSPTK